MENEKSEGKTSEDVNNQQNDVDPAVTTSAPETAVKTDVQAPETSVDNSESPAGSATSPQQVPDLAIVNAPVKQPKLIVRLIKRKLVSIPLATLLLLIVSFVVPATRYMALGLVVKKDVVVAVIDESTNTPVTDAVVALNGQQVTSDASGIAEFKNISVGEYEVKVSKKYYEDSMSRQIVGLTGDYGTTTTKPFKVSIKATGYPLNVTVVDKISGATVAGASVKAADVEAKTAKNGVASLVLPPATTKQKITVSFDGYNEANTEIELKANQNSENKVELTKSGKVYFLSKRSGKIDVVKTNLDGTERQVVLAGTGKEEDRGTVLLASRDWKYLALLSRRDSELPKLYLIETTTDKLTTIDEGSADFNLVGWAEDKFVYSLTRRGVESWQPKRQAIKAYNASTNNLKTLNETTGSGTGFADQKSETYNSVYAIGNEVVFEVYGSGIAGYVGSIKTDGAGFKKLKSMAAFDTITSLLYEPKEIYFAINSFGPATGAEYLEYEIGGSVSKISKSDFEKSAVYPTYLLSPTGTKNFWSEERDGKPVLFLGDDNAENSKEFKINGDKFKQYGWFSDTYVLMSLNDSELYIASSDPDSTQKPLKVTDYHKPQQTFPGYGGGYGGF